MFGAKLPRKHYWWMYQTFNLGSRVRISNGEQIRNIAQWWSNRLIRERLKVQILLFRQMRGIT